ncbi:MAG TPA: glycosyltransferase family A protein [Gemmatirosa sp.]
MPGVALPSVSVVIPCYNAGPYLAECLESVLAQTRPPLEVLVVDDGSTDDSADVASRFPVRLLRTSGRQGNMAARSQGAEAAVGDYIAMTDADDRLLPDHLEQTAGLLDRYPEVMLAASDAQAFGDFDFRFPAEVPSDAPHDMFWRAFRYWYLPYNAIVVRRESLRRALADHASVDRWGSDYLVTLRLAYAAPVISTGRITVGWRRHATQMSTQRWRQATGVHRHRAHFIAQVRRSETPERIRDMERIALLAWMEDLEGAYRDGDTPLFRSLLTVTDLVPGIPTRTLVWAHARLRFGAIYDNSPALRPVKLVYRLGQRVRRRIVGPAA